MPDGALKPLVNELEGELSAIGDSERAAGTKAYLKSDLQFIGIAIKPLRAVVRTFLANHPDLVHDTLRELVLALWERPVFELKAVAVELLVKRAEDLENDDLGLVEDLLRRSHTWALVDWLCTKVAASIVEGDPKATEPVLGRWALDKDFWIRRASMLAQLPALRAGGGDFALFASFASRMVEEKEFFIRKAIGWILRDVSKKRPELAYAFLAEHIGEVSGLTLREGSKYLPEGQKEELRNLHRTGKSAR